MVLRLARRDWGNEEAEAWKVRLCWCSRILLLMSWLVRLGGLGGGRGSNGCGIFWGR